MALRETTLKNGELEKELQTTRDERDKAQARYESEIQVHFFLAFLILKNELSFLLFFQVNFFTLKRECR